MFGHESTGSVSTGFESKTEFKYSRGKSGSKGEKKPSTKLGDSKILIKTSRLEVRWIIKKYRNRACIFNAMERAIIRVKFVSEETAYNQFNGLSIRTSIVANFKSFQREIFDNFLRGKKDINSRNKAQCGNKHIIPTQKTHVHSLWYVLSNTYMKTKNSQQSTQLWKCAKNTHILAHQSRHCYTAIHSAKKKKTSHQTSRQLNYLKKALKFHKPPVKFATIF